jgi:hypothetical protein
MFVSSFAAMKRLAVFVLMFAFFAMAQQPLDGPNRIFHDDLLDNLQGQWKVTGPVMGRPLEMRLTAEWVLNHQFLRFHEKAVSTAPGQPPYEADVYIGYDNTSERYVAHWLDIYGGRYSEFLGYGTRSGDSIRFTFEYPDGPFHNTFTWNPQAKSWRFMLENKDTAGKWKSFADQQAVKPE